MAELADAADSKSAGLRPMRVQVPLPAPILFNYLGASFPASKQVSPNCSDAGRGIYSAVFIGGARIARLRTRGTHGRIVEPSRTFLAGVGRTNMSQELGG